MATLSTIPDQVDIAHYGGDTLTVRIDAPAALVDGKVWRAQVRASREATTTDAEFEITEPTELGGPAFLKLSAAETERLVGTLATLVRVKELNMVRTIMRYQGVWDVQVSVSGSDPVTTLAQGTLTIDVDVTRGSALR